VKKFFIKNLAIKFYYDYKKIYSFFFIIKKNK
jgi:hypothetical protein